MMTQNETRIAYFITSHGYGHAARAASVMSALRTCMPAVRFDIFTQVPRWFFEESLRSGFEYHRLRTDVGLVQRTTLDEDIPETIRRLNEFLPFDEGIIRDVGETLRRGACVAVCCDISPLGIAVGRAAGIPTVLVENFTWDWIYEGYVDEYAGLQPHIDYLHEQFAAVDYHCQAEPVCAPREVQLRVPPVNRPARTPADTVRAALDLPQHAPMVLITMGGVSWEYTFFDHLADHENVYFVVPGIEESMPVPPNVRLLATDSPFYHPDLTNASDAVIGKAGYSTVAEVYCAGVPFGYVLRPRFREAHVLESFIREQMHALAIEPEHFRDGRWLCQLPALLDLPRVRRHEQNGADQIAAFIRDMLGDR